MELFEGIEEKYIETNGIKLHTMIIGEGEPIVMLHGFPDFWYGWKHIILGLKEEFKLIVPDTRGINLSDKPEGDKNYDIEVLADDIKGFSESLNLGKFTLAGHDWGGIIAWEFAEKYPNSLKRLIILNAPHPKILEKKYLKNKSQKKAAGYVTNLIKPGADKDMMADDFKKLKGPIFKVIDDIDKDKYREAWSRPGALAAGLRYYRANVRRQMSRRKKQTTGIIKAPTLVIHGMKDTFVLPVMLEGLEEYVKDLKIVRSEKGSHFVINDDPHTVISSIREFMKRKS
jgi:pimeloyl-ACP methyl ester carboxylesterase